MRIGLFTVLLQRLAWKQMLARVRQEGISAIEIGTGGYPGAHHCPLDELLASEARRSEYIADITNHGLIISAFSCQHEPLHPDPALAVASEKLFRKTVRLAAMVHVPVVNVLSSCPAGAAGDRSPNSVACPWPPHFKTMLDDQWNEMGIPPCGEGCGEALRYHVLSGIIAEELLQGGQQRFIGSESHPVYSTRTSRDLPSNTAPSIDGAVFDGKSRDVPNEWAIQDSNL